MNCNIELWTTSADGDTLRGWQLQTWSHYPQVMHTKTDIVHIFPIALDLENISIHDLRGRPEACLPGIWDDNLNVDIKILSVNIDTALTSHVRSGCSLVWQYTD